jgi:hypothetical protein
MTTTNTLQTPILRITMSESFEATFLEAWSESFIHIYPEDNARAILDYIQEGFLDYLLDETDDLDEEFQDHLIEYVCRTADILLEDFTEAVASLALGYGDHLLHLFQFEMMKLVPSPSLNRAEMHAALNRTVYGESVSPH